MSTKVIVYATSAAVVACIASAYFGVYIVKRVQKVVEEAVAEARG